MVMHEFEGYMDIRRLQRGVGGASPPCDLVQTPAVDARTAERQAPCMNRQPSMYTLASPRTLFLAVPHFPSFPNTRSPPSIRGIPVHRRPLIVCTTTPSANHLYNRRKWRRQDRLINQVSILLSAREHVKFVSSSFTLHYDRAGT